MRLSAQKLSQLATVIACGVLLLSACSKDAAKPEIQPGDAAPAKVAAPEPAQKESKDAAAATPVKPGDPVSAAPTGPIATVNGVAIPQSKLELMVKARAAQGQPDTPELRESLKDELITREIIAQAAKEKGLDNNPEIAAQFDLLRQSILINAYLEDYAKTHPVNDETMRQEYEKVKTVQGDVKEYKARHILVENEKEAKDIVAQLKKGGSFEKLAKEKSKDPGSKAKGGDLDWSTTGNYVGPFGDALKGLKKGEYTQTPVQTQFGYHVIKLEDERPYKFPEFEEVKPQLQQGMQQQQREKAINELKAKAKIG
ncbi:MAG: peptidylprolyl isomerase [Burkholderiales bacterium]|nr:peptidylprolyl isomerase [Burkholderiales bacterium]